MQMETTEMVAFSTQQHVHATSVAGCVYPRKRRHSR